MNFSRNRVASGINRIIGYDIIRTHQLVIVSGRCNDLVLLSCTSTIPSFSEQKMSFSRQQSSHSVSQVCL